ncbi:MAG: hypothetical protein EFKGCFLK_00990 [Rhodocyclaceae bacterium]|nr:MAG: hypothetical protein F9K21_04245 [Rhodocyclaceae bacterium]MBV6407429.1 hypothetical protein [Rhodocyclaceae bacterium]
MLHPTVRLIVWSALAVLVQWLPLGALSLICVAALAAAVWLAPARLAQLLKRTRWLMLALMLIFALATPGMYLLPALGGISPTEEGMWLGFEHLLRLLFVLSSLAALLHLTGPEGLVAGLHGLIWPLSWAGLDRRRMALRLMLVLHYAEQAPPGRHWREWLQGAAESGEPRRFVLQVAPLHAIDFAVLAGLTFSAAALIGSQS